MDEFSCKHLRAKEIKGVGLGPVVYSSSSGAYNQVASLFFFLGAFNTGF